MTYTSLKLSKKLKEAGCEWCNLPSEMMYDKLANENYGKLLLVKDWSKDRTRHALDGVGNSVIPAYDILNDICVKYAKEFFGEKEPTASNPNDPWKGQVCFHCGVDPRIQPPKESGCNHVHYPEDCDVCGVLDIGWEHYTQEILNLLQQNKQQEAEDYIWENCKFNNE